MVMESFTQRVQHKLYGKRQKNNSLKKDRTDDRTNHKRERSGICEVTQTRYHQGKHELSHS